MLILNGYCYLFEQQGNCLITDILYCNAFHLLLAAVIDPRMGKGKFPGTAAGALRVIYGM
jgi:hypothetical protein